MIQIFKLSKPYQNYDILLWANKNYVNGFSLDRSKKLFLPIDKAASSVLSDLSNYPLYFHFVAINLKWLSICFIACGKFYNSSNLQSLKIPFKISKSFLPIFKGYLVQSYK
jgi:hypothetical protein